MGNRETRWRMTTSSRGYGVISGGAFELGWQIPYAILMARDSIERHGLTQTLLPQLERELTDAPTPSCCR